MNNHLLDYINFTQLEVLGFKKEYFIVLFFLLSLIIFSSFIKLVMRILSSKKYLYVLTFMLNSLLFLTTTAVISQLFVNYTIFQLALQSVILYGVFLSIFMLYKYVKTTLFT